MKAMVEWPKNKDHLVRMLMLAFKAGCNWGYGVELAIDPGAQEELGARQFVGLISADEAFEEKQKIIEGGDQ